MWHGPALAELLEGFSHEQAAAHPIAGAFVRTHSAADMLRGVIEHGAYHGGQIAILKRALERHGKAP